MWYRFGQNRKVFSKCGWGFARTDINVKHKDYLFVNELANTYPGSNFTTPTVICRILQ